MCIYLFILLSSHLFSQFTIIYLIYIYHLNSHLFFQFTFISSIYIYHSFLGVELASAAVDVANARLESLKRNLLNGNENPLIEFNVEFRALSFFDLSTEKEDLFDFIYDYTFLCALDISVRTLWAEKMSDLLIIGGELMTLIFPLSETKEGGPPFKMSFQLLKDLLGTK